MEDEWDSTSIDVGTNEQRAEPYEQMCISLYAYRYGAISFLELIAMFEESLGLASPQTTLE